MRTLQIIVSLLAVIVIGVGIGWGVALYFEDQIPTYDDAMAEHETIYINYDSGNWTKCGFYTLDQDESSSIDMLNQFMGL